jgi:hypothetical protein
MNPQESNPTGSSSKRMPAVVTAILLLVLLSPILENWKSKPHDSFPLSYFPMFSFRRGSTITGNSLIGMDSEGNRVLLSFRLAGTGGFNQVRRQIAAKLKDKRGAEVCEQVASKVAASRKRSLRDVESVQVISAKHNIDRFFARGDSLTKEKVYATCLVPREASIATNTREETR